MESMGPVLGLICGGIVLLIFAGIGVYCIIAFNKSKKKAAASQVWPQTIGTITEARVVESSTSSDDDGPPSYSARLKYVYQVAGQKFEGNKLYFGAVMSGNRNKAEQTLLQYPIGSQVPVYYDPTNPADAVLQKAAPGNKVLLILGIIFLVISVCGGIPGLIALAASAFGLFS